MKWINSMLNRRSADTAKDRLRIVIAQERAAGTAEQPDFLPLLHKEILALIAKYTDINVNDVEVDVTHQEKSAVLKLNVVLNKSKNKMKSADTISSA